MARKRNEEIDFIKLCDAFLSSDYMLSAPGQRDVSYNETIKILSAIIENRTEPNKMLERLRESYKHDELTIKFSKNAMTTCDGYIEDSCDCYLPDIDFSHRYCQLSKIKKASRRNDRCYPEYKLWRNSVYERDDYTCQECGKIGGTLNAHHILPFSVHPDKRLDVKNGITLCQICHIETRRKQRGERCGY